MRLKSPVRDNADRVREVIRAGAPRIEEALRESRHVHFAWFELIESDTVLVLHTVYDGPFSAYIQHFALKVGDLFDALFECIENPPPMPVDEFPDEFVAHIQRYDRAPAMGYFFSAYPRSEVAQHPAATGCSHEAKDFADVQRLVLHGSPWDVGRHLALEFPEHVPPRAALQATCGTIASAHLPGHEARRRHVVVPADRAPGRRRGRRCRSASASAGAASPRCTCRRTCSAASRSKAPAFTAGAALRSSRHLGTTGRSAPPHWDEAFQHMTLDAVFSLHGDDDDSTDVVDEIERPPCSTTSSCGELRRRAASTNRPAWP